MPDRLAITKTYKLYINGGFPRSESGRSILVQNQRGDVLAHVGHGSRKDLRDAVEAAAAAQPKWASASAYNRGQVLYRMAEMLEGKRDEFADVLMESRHEGMKASRHRGIKKARHGGIEASRKQGSKAKTASRERVAANRADAAREVAAAIDRLVCFAGWADKYAQVLGCNNPVAGPYYNFTVPEPTGVVGVVSPPSPAPALLGLIALLAPPLCAGNAVVAIADDHAMLPAAIFGEVCATSDVPAGVINIITGRRAELLDHLARHRNVNAVSAANLSREESTTLKLGIAENLKRVHVAKFGDEDWYDADACEGPSMIEPFVEMKTIWHPSAV